ncbi:MAG: MBOAT family protein [Deltaproteobacteria bacterium]|nr:MAG: MBOAT family protein [Deltaproteobacteria bacterium]
MSFKSWSFLFFFVVVFVVHHKLPERFRWVWLLLASYVFYMGSYPAYAILLASSTLLSYGFGLKIEQSLPEDKARWLALSISLQLSLLLCFKYLAFAIHTWNAWTPWSLPVWKWVLPVGISFYTFQALSYTIDVYRGDIPATRDLGRFALYISFFPQLVAGPIERASRILPQLKVFRGWDANLARRGLRLMLAGFFLKIFIADQIGVVVNPIFKSVAMVESPSLVLATMLFAFQIYSDFAGYSLIAIGAASTLGVRLTINFNRPYLATSVAEFWRRWHITLSTWFRDYVYISLGGNRVHVRRLYFNLFVVFALSGLWHGAKWTFVIWGVLHGMFMIVGHATQGLRQRFSALIGLDRFPRTVRVFQVFVTFVLVCLGWVFFRADNLDVAMYILFHLFDDWSLKAWMEAITRLYSLPFVLSCLSILGLWVFDAWTDNVDTEEAFARWPVVLRWCTYLLALLLLFFWGAFQKEPFFYFQF